MHRTVHPVYPKYPPMMSIRTIRHLSDEAAIAAAKKKKVPYVPFNREEIAGYPPFPFPNIGSHRPKGWRLVKDLLCDKTGVGAEWEPALTVDGLRRALLELETLGSYGYAVIEEGQFQLSLGVFEKVKAKSTSNPDMYHAYMRGWTAGAKTASMDPKFSEHKNEKISKTYTQAYAYGLQARTTASKKASKLSKYTPSILREQDV